MLAVFFLIFFLPFTCSDNDVAADPILEILNANPDAPLTVLLLDMNTEGVLFKDYKHRYRVITEEGGRPTAKDTKWYDVSSSYFWQNENNMGMEVAARKVGETSKRVVAPPGYTNYIGNSQYGYWTNGEPQQVEGVHPRTSPAIDFWTFLPQYITLRQLLDLPAGKIYEQEHKEYRRYYSSGYAYYGPIVTSGRRRYGTYNLGRSSRTRTSSRWHSRGGGGFGK